MNEEQDNTAEKLNNTPMAGWTVSHVASEAIGKANLAGDIMKHAGLPKAVIQAAQGQMIADITVERLHEPPDYGKMLKR